MAHSGRTHLPFCSLSEQIEAPYTKVLAKKHNPLRHLPFNCWVVFTTQLFPRGLYNHCRILLYKRRRKRSLQISRLGHPFSLRLIQPFPIGR